MTAMIRPRPSLTEQVAREIERLIDAGDLKVGQQIPTERELQERFGVSRTVIREAIARLKVTGVVGTRQGAGVFVADKAQGGTFTISKASGDLLDLVHILELRTIVEVTVSGLAAVRRTDDDIAAIRSQLDRISKAIEEGADPSEADDAFHGAIAAAAKNPRVSDFAQFLCHRFSDSRRLFWSTEGKADTKSREAQAEHQAMLDAIIAKDPQGARGAAIAHMRHLGRRLGVAIRPEGGWDWIWDEKAAPLWAAPSFRC